MQPISRNKLKSMIDGDASFHLVEVLDQNEFDEFHLPGARNVPFNDQFDDRIASLAPDTSDTIVVYCKNADCPASAKAAQRLEELGYTEVLDYEDGKEDWKAAGLPIEAPTGSAPR